MSILCLAIKKEPEELTPTLPDEGQSKKSDPPEYLKMTEFVNVKIEYSETPAIIRVKEETDTEIIYLEQNTFVEPCPQQTAPEVKLEPQSSNWRPGENMKKSRPGLLMPPQYSEPVNISVKVEPFMDEDEKQTKCENSSVLSNLSQNEHVHFIEKLFKCTQCGKEFINKAGLVKHQQYCTGPIKCEICHKEFKTAFLKKSHLQKHTVGKPFACNVCDMNFKTSSALKRHSQMHDGVRPFNCEHCEKAFTHKSLLKLHVRKHTGEKPYKCPICHKPFSHKHNMEKHKTIHNKEKKTTCEICNKQFPRESRLKYHMRTHVFDKYFQCYVCPMKFTHKQNIIRHYERKHPTATYDGTDTDASVATKIWEDLLNKKFEVKETVHNDNDKKSKLSQNDSEPEEILPDLDVNEIDKSKKEKLAQIERFNREITGKRLKQKIFIRSYDSADDSDDEVLAKKVRKKINQVEIGVCKTTDGIERLTEGNNELTSGNEQLSVGNKGLKSVDDRLLNDNNIEVKNEVFSDEEEILP